MVSCREYNEHIRLKELIADNEFKEGQRITFDKIAKATIVPGINLSKIAKQKSYNTTIEVLDKLCAYFEVALDSVAEYVEMG